MYALLVIGGINTVFSLFYYLKVLKVMVLEKPLEELENRPAAPLRLPVGATVFASLMAAGVVLGGVAFNTLAEASDKGASDFYTPLAVGTPTGNRGTGAAPAGAGAAPRPAGGAPAGGQPKEKTP